MLAITTQAGADEYPERPVTFVVAFGVGGSADRMTRTMSTYIGDALGQPVTVINKRGAGTLLASNYMLDQKPSIRVAFYIRVGEVRDCI